MDMQRRKKLKILETENIHKQFKTNQNNFKSLTCIEKANRNNQWEMHVRTLICC